MITYNELTSPQAIAQLRDYLVLALRTTGPDPVSDRIFQLGMLRVEDGEIVNRNSTLIDPGVPIPAELSELTGITDADAARGLLYPQMAASLAKLLLDGVVAADEEALGFVRTMLEAEGFSGSFSFVDVRAFLALARPELTGKEPEQIAEELHISTEEAPGILQDAALRYSLLQLCQRYAAAEDEEPVASAGIRETFKVPGVLPTLIGFFAYCSGEATCFLWTSSYFSDTRPWLSPDIVAAFGSLIFGGLMLGRIISGFISNKLGDKLLIRAGIVVELVGIALVALPLEGYVVAAIGFLLVGTGMGPIYPAIQDMAPDHFGARHAAAVISLQMASAYTGSTLMPMAFGHLQQALGIWVMPIYLLIFAILNIALLEYSYRVTEPVA